MENTQINGYENQIHEDDAQRQSINGFQKSIQTNSQSDNRPRVSTLFSRTQLLFLLYQQI